MKKKDRDIMIIGDGGVGKTTTPHQTAMTSMRVAMSMGEFQLKDSNKTLEQKQVEVIEKLRKGLSDKMIMEYLLIRNKKSDLSRKKRDYVESCINKFVLRGMITQEELNLINQKKI